MNEPVIDHIQRLERSNRFWKTTTFCLLALLLSMSIFSGTFFTMMHARSLRAMDAAIMEQVEAAERQAERALEAAKEGKKE